MGVKLAWHRSVLSALTTLTHPVFFINDDAYDILECSPKLYLNLVSLRNHFHPDELINLQENFQNEGKLLVHLWEDVWQLNQKRVLSRIKSFLGLNCTLHARKAVLVELDSTQAVNFFNDTHLQGYVKAKHYYGLLVNNELIAMASFSDLRPMKLKGVGYTSAELIRFASKDGFTITGGLSKLIKHFLKIKNPNDLMSYADRDWSLGSGYHQLGFELSGVTGPAYLYVELTTLRRYFPHRLPKNILTGFHEQKEVNLETYLVKNGFEKVFNTGNLKYHLYV
ncbi:hypothetical protein [Pedobacter insulae]|uniref:Uncharacterized protein n=1 Tax=Pedobacter insulae TaxID=414048 RepID=A0A1I2UHZ7_9SPHI|nr:hypothetical protein [Pedobacter insulae]SFG76670.1 hypothetical protein SAMN04489864_102173 [Pedobacter insulae]